jgi:hypothetical protein
MSLCSNGICWLRGFALTYLVTYSVKELLWWKRDMENDILSDARYYVCEFSFKNFTLNENIASWFEVS